MPRNFKISLISGNSATKNTKKGLPNGKERAIIRRVSNRGRAMPTLGCRQAVRHQTLTLAFVGSNPAIPARLTLYGSLAQLVEQRPFKAWVQGSSPWRATKKWDTHPGIPLFDRLLGTRKAVKKTVRWTVFRPWESPSDSGCIRKDVDWIRADQTNTRPGIGFLDAHGIRKAVKKTVRWGAIRAPPVGR